jgi:hypothetical protein
MGSKSMSRAMLAVAAGLALVTVTACGDPGAGSGASEPPAGGAYADPSAGGYSGSGYSDAAAELAEQKAAYDALSEASRYQHEAAMDAINNMTP